MEDLVRIEKKIDILTEKIELMSSLAKVPETVSVADIAKLNGLSRTDIAYNKPYLLPDFGKSEFPVGKKRWTIEKYHAWEAIPLEKRKAEWERRSKTDAKD